MAKAYSIDLREKIANAQGSYGEISKRFEVSKSTVWKYKNQQQEKGTLEAQYSRTSHRKLLDDEKITGLKAYIKANSNATQLQMCQFIMDTYGIRIAQSTMNNYLKKIKISLKKSSCETRKQILKK